MTLTKRQRKYLRTIKRTRSSPYGVGYLVAGGMAILAGIIFGLVALLSLDSHLGLAACCAVGYGGLMIEITDLYRDLTAIILSLDQDGDSAMNTSPDKSRVRQDNPNRSININQDSP